MRELMRNLTRRHWFFVAIDRYVIGHNRLLFDGILCVGILYVEPLVLGLVQTDGPGNVIDFVAVNREDGEKQLRLGRRQRLDRQRLFQTNLFCHFRAVVSEFSVGHDLNNDRDSELRIETVVMQ